MGLYLHGGKPVELDNQSHWGHPVLNNSNPTSDGGGLNEVQVLGTSKQDPTGAMSPD